MEKYKIISSLSFTKLYFLIQIYNYLVYNITLMKNI